MVWSPEHLFYAMKSDKSFGGHQRRRFQPQQRHFKKGAITKPENCIWVGGIKDGTTFLELKAHGEHAGNARWAEVYSFNGKGTGVIGYASAEEAASAVDVLNGTRLKGSILETDLYQKKEKSAGFSGKKNWLNHKRSYRIWGQKKRTSRIKNPSNVVWVSGLPDGATFQELKAHGESAGNARWAEVYNWKGKGTGLIGYASSEEAISAAAALDGSTFMDAIIETDLYVKGESASHDVKGESASHEEKSSSKKQNKVQSKRHR
jgi:RNA recognition motif-containing protein